MKHVFLLCMLLIFQNSIAQEFADIRAFDMAPFVATIGINNSSFVNNGTLLPARSMQHSLLYFYQNESNKYKYPFELKTHSIYFSLNIGITKNHQISLFLPYQFSSELQLGPSYYSPAEKITIPHHIGNAYINYHINILGKGRFIQFAPRFSFLLPAKQSYSLSKTSAGMALLLPFSKEITKQVSIRGNLGFTHFFNQKNTNYNWFQYNPTSLSSNLNDTRVSGGILFNSKKRIAISTDFEYRISGLGNRPDLSKLQFNFQPCITYSIIKAKYIISPIIQSNINLLYNGFGANVGLVFQHRY
jgi:hypothetical protein